jgi:hypothetical protein
VDRDSDDEVLLPKRWNGKQNHHHQAKKARNAPTAIPTPCLRRGWRGKLGIPHECAASPSLGARRDFLMTEMNRNYLGNRALGKR